MHAVQMYVHDLQIIVHDVQVRVWAGPCDHSKEQTARMTLSAQLFVAFTTQRRHHCMLLLGAAGPVFIYTDICNMSHACRADVCA